MCSEALTLVGSLKLAIAVTVKTVLEATCIKRPSASGFSPEIFEGVVAFSGVVKLGRITKVT